MEIKKICHCKNDTNGHKRGSEGCSDPVYECINGCSFDEPNFVVTQRESRDGPEIKKALCPECGAEDIVEY